MNIFIIMVLLNVARIKNEYDMDEGETWTGAWSILWNGFPMRERIARLGKHLPRTWPCQMLSNKHQETNLLCQMFSNRFKKHLDGWPQGGYEVVVEGDC